MTKLFYFILTVVMLYTNTSCVITSYAAPPTANTRVVKARITYYCGRDKWGSRVACPKTRRANRGVTVAAHPDFKFGQKIYIPKLKNIIGDGYFNVQDRGGAVTKRRASKGKTYVFDVYVSSYNELKRNARKLPMYMNVHIIR
tara:strand:+ start:1756 stop:2184 length:429 start_codon:yes stop_codon:yes gene_type:complete